LAKLFVMQLHVIFSSVRITFTLVHLSHHS
jgi:hypothetical protein